MSIDEIIKQDARKKLEERLNIAFEPAFNECRLGNSTKTKFAHSQGEYLDHGKENYLSASQCLVAARAALLERLLPQAEVNAIENFYRKVANLEDIKP